MPSLLVINASPRGGVSVSRRLTAVFQTLWKTKYPQGQIVLRDLQSTALPYVSDAWINAAFAPPGARSNDMEAALAGSDGLVAELLVADHIVIGTPMYNFAVPAVLKAYIDQIVRKDVTFTMDYKGLVTGKKATVILTSGFSYEEGSQYESLDAASRYLRQILGFIGITDVSIVRAGKAVGVEAGELTIDQFVATYAGELAAAAR